MPEKMEKNNNDKRSGSTPIFLKFHNCVKIFVFRELIVKAVIVKDGQRCRDNVKSWEIRIL